MKSKDNLNYCIQLSPSQVKFLSDPIQGTSRCTTFLSMIAMARIEEEKGGGDADVHVGQLSAPITRLADQWSVNPKTARKLIQHFNDQGLVRTESSPFGSVHTMLCLSGWIKDSLAIRNPFCQIPETPNVTASENVSFDADHGGSRISCSDSPKKEPNNDECLPPVQTDDYMNPVQHQGGTFSMDSISIDNELCNDR